MDVGYWYDAIEHGHKVDLGFDSSVAEHTYAFTWSETHLTVSVDGKFVVHVDGTAGTDLPNHAMQVTVIVALGTQSSCSTENL